MADRRIVVIIWKPLPRKIAISRPVSLREREREDKNIAESSGREYRPVGRTEKHNNNKKKKWTRRVVWSRKKIRSTGPRGGGGRAIRRRGRRGVRVGRRHRAPPFRGHVSAGPADYNNNCYFRVTQRPRQITPRAIPAPPPPGKIRVGRARVRRTV